MHAGWGAEGSGGPGGAVSRGTRGWKGPSSCQGDELQCPGDRCAGLKGRKAGFKGIWGTGTSGARVPEGAADVWLLGCWATGSGDPEWPALSSASHRDLEGRGPVSTGVQDHQMWSWGGRRRGGVPSFQQVLQTLSEPGLWVAEG